MKPITVTVLTSLAIFSLGLALPATGAQEQQSAEKTAAAKTWISVAGYVTRPEGCGAQDATVRPPGVLSFTLAGGNTAARFVEYSPLWTIEPSPLLSIYLTADVVRADGSSDPAFGSKPQNILIESRNDGRILVRFVDFSEGEFTWQ